ncbi:MAG: hypothetical protein HY931_01815 [Candidatus Falkowbacteria bacterium]|nr:MAG: hypothetical protein HY931_01815 [Candidatus Falkowbacteria bacterium]
MIKIYFNPNYPELIFSIGAIMANKSTSEKKEEHLVAFIATNPWEMDGEENELKKEIVDLAEDMIAKAEDNPKSQIEPEKVFDEISKDEIIILNIHPLNQEELAYLMNFFERHQDNISLWVDSSNYWSPSVVNYLKEYGQAQILFDKEKSCLELLAEAGFTIEPEWKEAAKEITNPTTENAWATRYIAALWAASMIDNNCEEGLKNYFQAFARAADEVWKVKRDQNLDDLVNDFVACDQECRLLKKALEETATDPQDDAFPLAKAAGRPIGYLHLPNINPALDLSALLEFGTAKFPWLFLIFYNIGEDYNVLANSEKIPLDQIESWLETHQEEKLMLDFLEKSVVKFKI